MLRHLAIFEDLMLGLLKLMRPREIEKKKSTEKASRLISSRCSPGYSVVADSF